MTQTIGVFAPLEQRNAYEPGGCPESNPIKVADTVPPMAQPRAMQRARAAVRNPGFLTGRPQYVDGYQGYKFYNPSEGGGYEGGGYEGEKFYNPSEWGGYEDNPCCGAQENPLWPGSVAPPPVDAGPWPGSTRPHPQGRPWPGNIRARNPMDEGTMVVEKTVIIKHPRTHRSHKVSVVSVRSVGPGLGEVVVDDDYAMLWDIGNNRPLFSSVQACPMGYRLYGGRCFRKVRSTNPKGCKTDADCPQEPCATSCAEYVKGVYDPQCVVNDPLCSASAFRAAPLPTQPSRFPPGTITSSSLPAPGYPDPFPPPPTCASGYGEWCKKCESFGGNITLGGDCKLPDGHIVAKPSKPTAPGVRRLTAPMPVPVPAGIARVAAIRENNPRHPVYLNRLSLPWQYPWTYTHNPNTLQWGYVHPRWGYSTPWQGWGGWNPGYEGRSYYDDRTVCERVEETQSCPTGTIVERDPDGNKMCCEQDGPNPWYQATTYPYFIWWCPGCGNYPRRDHGRHRGHGAHGGPRGGSAGGVVGRGGGMIRTGGGARGTGGGGGGMAMSGGATGGGGGAIGSGGGGISTGGGVSNPAEPMESVEMEAIYELPEHFEENPRVQPWDLASGRQRNAPPTLPPPEPVPPPTPPPGEPPIPPIGEPLPLPGISARPSVQPGMARPMAVAPMQRPMQRSISTRVQAPRAQTAMRGMVRR